MKRKFQELRERPSFEAKPLSQVRAALRGLCNEAVFASLAAEAQAPVEVEDEAVLSTTV
jgi:hypothetical protein